MYALARKHDLLLQDEGRKLVRDLPTGQLVIDARGVWWVRQGKAAPVHRREGQWSVDDEPWPAGEELPEPLDRLLPEALSRDSPVDYVLDALADDWLASHASHLLDASELDLASVHAPFPLLLLGSPLLVALTLAASLQVGEPILAVLCGVVVFVPGLLLLLLMRAFLQTSERKLAITRDTLRFLQSTSFRTQRWTIANADLESVTARGRTLLLRTRSGETREIVLQGRSANTATAVARVIERRVRNAVHGSREDVPEVLRRVRQAGGQDRDGWR